MKRLSLLLAGIMLTVSLAGCGSSESTESANAAGTENTAEDTASSEGVEAAAQNTETVEIRAWHDNDEAMMNALADVVNEN